MLESVEYILLNSRLDQVLDRDQESFIISIMCSRSNIYYILNLLEENIEAHLVEGYCRTHLWLDSWVLEALNRA